MCSAVCMRRASHLWNGVAAESCDRLEVETAYCVRSERCPMMNLPFIDQRCPCWYPIISCVLIETLINPHQIELGVT